MMAVSLRAVTKRFGSVEVLAGIDLDIPEGQLVALLGPNGAGKSTAISVMLGLRRPSAGTVHVLGLEPRQAVERGRVGAMLQTGGLPPGLTARALVAFMARLYPRPLAVAEVLGQVGLDKVADRPVERLSGGESQRLRFAMCLVGRPELIFLDEPTVGFDVENRRRFWDSVRESAEHGTTVLFCTHYLEEADQEAGRIVVLQHGRIVADGTGEAIKAQVGGRVLRFVWPGADAAALGRLGGVRQVNVQGERVRIVSADGDRTVRDLVAGGGPWRDIEVGGGDLEEAFLTLTSDAGAGSAQDSADAEVVRGG